jgi:histone H1/5
MEIIIAIAVVVIGAFIYFNRKPKTEATSEVPYKVDAPTPVAEQATQAVVESIEVKEAPAKKPRAPRAPAAKKPAAKKAPAAKKPKAK